MKSETLKRKLELSAMERRLDLAREIGSIMAKVSMIKAKTSDSNIVSDLEDLYKELDNLEL